MRISWDEVFGKNIIEFLNVVSYIQDKVELDKQRMRDYEKNVKHYG